MLTDKELEEIRHKLQGLEQEPPADGWKSIKAEIYPPSINWRPLWWLGGLLLLLLTGIGGYLMLDKHADSLSSQTKLGQTIAEKGAGKQTEIMEKENASGKVSDSKANTNTESPVALPQKSEKTDEVPKKRSEINAADELPEKQKADNAPHIAGKTSKTISDSLIAEREVGHLQPVAADSAAITTSVDSTGMREEPSKKQKKQRATLSDRSGWAIGAYIAPRYSFRKITSNAEDKILITGLNAHNRLDTERLGYETGLSISKPVKNNLSLEAGLSLINLREDVDYTYTLGEVERSVMRQNSDGSIVVEAIHKSEERQLVSSYTYGGLRVGVNYYVLQTPSSRINFSFAGGMNLLLKGRTKEYRNFRWIETVVFPDKNNLLEQSNYNLQAGVGYNVALHPKYELMVMPAINYFLGSTFKEREPFGLRPYTLGINVQVKRSLGR